MSEHLLRISGVHYGANGDFVAGQKDTEEMHVRTRELLSLIDRTRPIVTLSPDPTNHIHERAIQARVLGQRIGRVAFECVEQFWSLLRQSGQPMMLAHVKEVAVRNHGYVMVAVNADDSQAAQPQQTPEIEWKEWLADLPLLPPSEEIQAEQEVAYVIDQLFLPRLAECNIKELKTYLDIWLKGSQYDLSREARQKRSLYIEQLEAAQDKDVRQLAEALKEQRRRICERAPLDKQATTWWNQRLESVEMQRLWLQWWMHNEGQLWASLREVDERLRHLPGELYLDIGKRDVVLSRLYYMNTPRQALDAIITQLMLRELTCRQLGIEMKPMLEKEYGSDVQPTECDELLRESPIYLNKAKGQKIDLIRVLNALFELGCFKGKDGSKLTKKEFFTEMGHNLHIDLSDYDKDLSRSMSDSTKLEKHLKIFEDMKQKMTDIWNSR